MDGIDLLVKNGAVWTPGGFVDADIAVKDGKIAALGKPPVLPDAAAAVSYTHLTLPTNREV